MSDAGVALVGVAIAVGLAGVVLPVLPGALLVWAAIAAWAIAVGSPTAWAALAAATLLTAAGQVVKYLVPGRRLRDAGVPRQTIVAGVAVAVIGFFVIPVVGFFLGVGVTMWTVWLLSTLLGHTFGGILGDARTYGVDFLLGAFFAVAAVGFWKKAKDASPLVVAVIVAVIVERIVPGPWYILLGALSGSLAGAMRRGRAA